MDPTHRAHCLCFLVVTGFTWSFLFGLTWALTT